VPHTCAGLFLANSRSALSCDSRPPPVTSFSPTYFEGEPYSVVHSLSELSQAIG